MYILDFCGCAGQLKDLFRSLNRCKQKQEQIVEPEEILTRKVKRPTLTPCMIVSHDVLVTQVTCYFKM